MASRKIERLKLDPAVTLRLIQGGIRTSRLMTIADLSYYDVQSLLSSAASSMVHPKTALTILQDRQNTSFFSSTGVNILDKMMGGGLIVGTISEVCGPPGIGKSQLCMGCCAATLLQADAVGRGGVVYIDTELKFSPARLQEIVQTREPRAFSPRWTDDAPHRMDSLLRRISVRRPLSCKELKAEVDGLQDFVVEHSISLVVVDSIAALARKEGLTELDKEVYVLAQASTLKQLAELCRCCVIVTNQVVSSYGNGADGGGSMGDLITDREGLYVPALGSSWHHCVTSRVVMHTDTQSDHNTGEDVRRMHLVKSPLMETSSCDFEIGPEGVCEFRRVH